MAQLNCNDTNKDKKVSNTVIGAGDSSKNRNNKKPILKLVDYIELIFGIIVDGILHCYNIYIDRVNPIITRGLIFISKKFNFADNKNKLIKYNKKNYKKLLLSCSIISFVLVLSTMVLSSFKIGIIVSHNNNSLGIIEKQDVLFSAYETINTRGISSDFSNLNVNSLDFKLKLVNKDNLVDQEQLANSIMHLLENYTQNAFGLYIDDIFYGAAKEKEFIISSLQEIISVYLPKNRENIVSVSFLQDIQIKPGIYFNDTIVNKDDIQDTFQFNPNEPNKIFLKNVLPTNFSTNKLIHDNINIDNNPHNFLSVSIVKRETFSEPIPYATIKKEDSSFIKGYSNIDTKGIEGTSQLTANVMYIDGIKTKVDITDSITISNPVDEVIILGSKQPEAIGSKISTKGYIWPVAGNAGYTTSTYSSYHPALDIAAPYATSILAIAPGTVVSAGWNGSYGYQVVINHGNGIIASYSHASALYAKVGQKVSQGQAIAAIGSTGNSTGNHLHIEISVNGSKLNPMAYIK